MYYYYLVKVPTEDSLGTYSADDQYFGLRICSNRSNTIQSNCCGGGGMYSRNSLFGQLVVL